VIRRIRGKVIEVLKDRAVIDVSGFGVEVFCDEGTLNEFDVSDEVFLYTIVTFGEEPRIFGFSDERKLRVFEKLLKVSKIGPKVAIRILSSAEPDMIVSAIKTEDVESLSKLPGIGTKTAERIVTELKKEFEDFEVMEIRGFSQAVEALEALGYSFKEASRAIREISKPGMSLEDLIKEALKKLSKR
jgi:Holliday junction DNA helicase RuvA